MAAEHSRASGHRPGLRVAGGRACPGPRGCRGPGGRSAVAASLVHVRGRRVDQRRPRRSPARAGPRRPTRTPEAPRPTTDDRHLPPVIGPGGTGPPRRRPRPGRRRPSGRAGRGPAGRSWAGPSRVHRVGPTPRGWRRSTASPSRDALRGRRRRVRVLVAGPGDDQHDPSNPVGLRPARRGARRSRPPSRARSPPSAPASPTGRPAGIRLGEGPERDPAELAQEPVLPCVELSPAAGSSTPAIGTNVPVDRRRSSRPSGGPRRSGRPGAAPAAIG